MSIERAPIDSRMMRETSRLGGFLVGIKHAR
jgi:hypothetical protein